MTQQGEAGGTHAHLVYMANQIARNFETMGDGAAKATADHIASFWDPRMKAAIWDDPEGLSPIASTAFALLRADGAPEAQTRATKFGDDRSDAG